MGDGLVQYTYERTVRMSTYLVAFVVGEFDHVEQMSDDGILTRVFTAKVQNAHAWTRTIP